MSIYIIFGKIYTLTLYFTPCYNHSYILITYVLTLTLIYYIAGYSDPVYAEATVTVHDYDIVLDILIINRTSSTLTNLTVDLATMGDLKLVER